MSLLKVYSNGDEVIVFPLDSNGVEIGFNEYFGEDGDRCEEDYDVTTYDGPVEISTRVKHSGLKCVRP